MKNVDESRQDDNRGQGPDRIVTPRRGALLAGHDNRLEVLVRLPCADAPEGHARPSLNLAFVIDRSGSMSGHPLEEAKHCVRRMIEQLAARDRASLAVYDDQAQVIVPSRPVDDRSTFDRALAGVHPGGCTNLHDGWALGAQQVASHLGDAGVARVILLSDGNANQGETDPATIADRCGQLAREGVGTSTYGLGVDFNEDLMVRMARSGGGKAYYGESADHLMEPFLQEFSLLSSMLGRAVRLDVRAIGGSKVECANPYPAAGDGAWILPDLAWGGEAWAVLRVTIPKAIVDRWAGDGATWIETRVTWTDLDGGEHVLDWEGLHLPVLGPAAYEALAEDELVARRAGELEAADLQLRARAAAQRRDWNEVDRLLRTARSRAGTNAWVAEVVSVLEEIARERDEARFAKEAMYASAGMSTRLSAPCEPSYSARDAEAAAPAHLRRKTRQGRTEFEK